MEDAAARKEDKVLFGDSMSDLCWIRIHALESECSDCPNRMSDLSLMQEGYAMVRNPCLQ